MSHFEMFLIIMVLAVPVIALFFVFPKKRNKEKTENKKVEPVKTYEDLKKEEVKETPVAEVVLPKTNIEDEFGLTQKDFESYVDWKSKQTTKPNHVELPHGFVGNTMPYIPNRKRKTDDKPQNLTEEIQNLSPELKALIIAGVLDPKNFDKM